MLKRKFKNGLDLLFFDGESYIIDIHTVPKDGDIILVYSIDRLYYVITYAEYIELFDQSKDYTCHKLIASSNEQAHPDVKFIDLNDFHLVNRMAGKTTDKQCNEDDKAWEKIYDAVEEALTIVKKVMGLSCKDFIDSVHIDMGRIDKKYESEGEVEFDFYLKNKN